MRYHPILKILHTTAMAWRISNCLAAGGGPVTKLAQLDVNLPLCKDTLPMAPAQPVRGCAVQQHCADRQLAFT